MHQAKKALAALIKYSNGKPIIILKSGNLFYNNVINDYAVVGVQI
jgi:acyl-CoA synthetase (NDP forming)